MTECNCGGIGQSHWLGDECCFREIFTGQIRPISINPGRFLVDGSVVTRFTLMYQRCFYYHVDIKKWSAPKDKDSVNSITA